MCDVFQLVAMSDLMLSTVARWLFTLESNGVVVDGGGCQFTWALQDTDAMVAMAQVSDDARVLVWRFRAFCLCGHDNLPALAKCARTSDTRHLTTFAASLIGAAISPL